MKQKHVLKYNVKKYKIYKIKLYVCKKLIKKGKMETTIKWSTIKTAPEFERELFIYDNIGQIHIGELSLVYAIKKIDGIYRQTEEKEPQFGISECGGNWIKIENVTH